MSEPTMALYESREARKAAYQRRLTRLLEPLSALALDDEADREALTCALVSHLGPAPTPTNERKRDAFEARCRAVVDGHEALALDSDEDLQVLVEALALQLGPQ